LDVSIMPRPARQDYEGAWHHVMNRGAGKRPIFVDDADRRRFLAELHHACSAQAIEIAAYCLLSNHYHVVLHTPSAGLARAMQALSSNYTKAHNVRHGLDGPVFRGRFMSVEIVSTAQIVQSTLYVHRNPVTAGLVARPEAWAWSSAACYAGSAMPPDWLNVTSVLDMIGGNDSRAEYARLLGLR